MPSLEQPQSESGNTRPRWCIDRNPADVDYEWIKRNAFQLKDVRDGATAAGKIKIGAYTLETAGSPGRIRMKAPSGQISEVDETVFEDLLKSFF